MDVQAKKNAVAAVVCGVGVASALATDGRSHGTPRVNVSSFPSETLEMALAAPHTKWFNHLLHCDRASFLAIYKLLFRAWPAKPHHSAKNRIIRRVALTMLYLAQGGSMEHAGGLIGISHTRAVAYINETLRVIVSLAASEIAMPKADELHGVEEGFYKLAGFPGVVSAVDGTLIRIPRPADFEGWYCRKGFPAVNVQAVVDHRGAFRSLSIRAGSANDQSLWNSSGVRQHLASHVPPGKHILGNAGYKVWGHLLAPYPEAAAARSCKMRRYNYRHSRTRIVVECAFGRVKNRFRIILGKLEQKSDAHITDVIVAFCVLHNLLQKLRDTYQVTGDDPLLPDAPSDTIGGDHDAETPTSHSRGLAKRDDIAEMFQL